MVSSSGGVALNTLVQSGATATIVSGGVTSNMTVQSGGAEILEFSGIASNTTVSAGGTLAVLFAGLADPTTIVRGGTEIVSAGGTDKGALVSGTQFDSGFASGAISSPAARSLSSPAVSRAARSFRPAAR